ncbi:hypothetical protein D1007_57613 [Hordeum vulgare]|nr:hypothetical protein D1007_57613 [Hordeum vulgare]
MDSKPEAHTVVAPPLAYPRMSPDDLARPPTPPVVATAGSNPYVLSSPSSRPPAISTKENLMEMFIQIFSTCCSISPHGMEDILSQKINRSNLMLHGVVRIHLSLDDSIG